MFRLKTAIANAFANAIAIAIAFAITTCVSCGSTKVVTQSVHDVSVDTIYLSNVQYDSIYISHDRIEKDTLILSPYKGEQEGVLIKETNVEYRYKLLRDTIFVKQIDIQRDSIPYEVHITEIKEVRKPPTTFDYLCYLSFGILIGIIGWKASKLIPSRH